MSNDKHFEEKNIQTILKHVLLEQYIGRWKNLNILKQHYLLPIIIGN